MAEPDLTHLMPDLVQIDGLVQDNYRVFLDRREIAFDDTLPTDSVVTLVWCTPTGMRRESIRLTESASRLTFTAHCLEK